MGSCSDHNTNVVELNKISGKVQEVAKKKTQGTFSRFLKTCGIRADWLNNKNEQTVSSAMPKSSLSLSGLGALRGLRVHDVAKPKAEIIAVPIDIKRDELISVFREQGFSRLPVYRGTLDHPHGLVLLKDIALKYGFGGGGTFSLKNMLRPVLYAPPSMPLGVLLQKMQSERVHMALVIDEYGGVDGLVTIEDLIETIIGEIDDEHDEVEGSLWKEESPGIFLAQSIAPLDEFEVASGFNLRTSDEDCDIDTIGGLVFLRIGRVPARGEVILHETGVEFEIVDADPRRIKRLRVRGPKEKNMPLRIASVEK